MKLLAIVLALAVISGCHGGMLPMDDWEDWETTVDRLNEFFSDLTSQVERVVEDIRDSQFSRELDMPELALLDNIVGDIRATMHTYDRKLRKRLIKNMELINKNVAAYVEGLQTRIADNMDNVDEQLDELQAWFESIRANKGWIGDV